jgi:hypothetical protein
MNQSQNLTEFLAESLTISKDVTFKNAKTERIHRWFPYLEGFAEKFIQDLIFGSGLNPRSIYEPFAGSGTLPVYCQNNNVDVYFSEVNPFLHHLIQLKLDLLALNLRDRELLISELDMLIEGFDSKVLSSRPSESLQNSYLKVFGDSKYFADENFDHVLRLRTVIDEISNPYIQEVIQIAACEALLHSSYLKRAGDIRYKKASEYHQIKRFNSRVVENLQVIKSDLAVFEDLPSSSKKYYSANAKQFDPHIQNQIDVVITSPPYLNGTNYIRNTKLELWFLGYLKEKKDLNYYRKEVITSGINDVGSELKTIKLDTLDSILADKSLWYDKRIPKMINDYFFDMRLVFRNMFLYMREGGKAFIDIGDSVYGGIHIKTDEILIELLKSEGFKYIDNIRLRERRSKGGQMVKQTLIVVEK